MQGFDSSSLALCLVGQHAVEQVLLPTTLYAHCQIRDSIVVSISACHAEDPGSIPGRGVMLPRRLALNPSTRKMGYVIPTN